MEKILSTSPLKKKNLESSFYQKLKKNQKKCRPSLRFTRLESWASLGVPDLVVCSERGKFYFVELKTTKGSAVRLSPHQVSWMTQHKHAPTYIFVHTKDADIFVYAGEQAIELLDRGLLLKPQFKFSNPVNWQELLDLTFDI
jgi:hypothetical protein